MKKILYTIASLATVALMSTSCELFELDNFDGPDAKIQGKLIDSKTGETIQNEAYQTESTFSWGSWTFTSKDWTSGWMTVVEDVSDRWEGGRQEQSWYVKFDGTYQNDIIFAGKYTMDFKKLGVYNPDPLPVIDVKKGSNTFDFTLTPYCRIVDPVFTYEGTKVKCTFSVELGDASKANNVAEVILCSHTTNFVGKAFNMASKDATAKKANVKPGEKITLELDTTAPANAEQFKYSRPQYFRIAALAKNAAKQWWEPGYDPTAPSYNTESIYNYSEVFVMDKNHSFSKFDWAATRK